MHFLQKISPGNLFRSFWPRDEETVEMRSEIHRMVWPCMVELVLFSLFSMIDTVMVGWLNYNAINAVSICDNPIMISFVIFQAFNVGGTALASRFIGQNDVLGARRTTVMVLWCNLIFGALVSVVEFIYARELVAFMGASPAYIDMAETYMRYAAIGVLFTAIPSAITAQLRAVGNTRISLQYNIIANVVNTALNSLLIFGLGPFPVMGVEGAAIATLVSKVVACVISLVVIFTNVHMPVRVKPKDFLKLDFGIALRVARVGLPSAIEQIVMRIGLITFTRLVAGIGDVAYSAHNITMKLQGLAFNVSQSFGIVASALTGRSLGEKKPDKAEKYIRLSRRSGLVASLSIGIIFAFFGRQLGYIFTNEAALLDWVGIIMIPLALTMPAQTSNLVLGGALRGAGDTIWPLVGTICGLFIMRSFMATVFVRVLDWGLIGAWIAFLLDQYSRATVTLLRFNSGKWKLKKV